MNKIEKLTLAILKRCIYLPFFLMFCFNTSAQGIRDDDKLDEVTAKARKDNFHGQFGQKKDITTSVRFSVDQLQEVLNAYKAANIDTIPFVFAMIRFEDGDKYAKKHRLVSREDKNKILNQPTLLIKGPPIDAAGLKRMYFGNFYYDIGSICPPPEGSCD